MSKDWYQDIKDFHKVMHQHIADSPSIPSEEVKKLRKEIINEEVNRELLPAIETNDLVAIADGAADAIVVILGTCISYGIDLRPIWDEVHRTNMAKQGGPIREDGKQLKPEGWKPPRVKELIQKQGAKL